MVILPSSAKEYLPKNTINNRKKRITNYKEKKPRSQELSRIGKSVSTKVDEEGDKLVHYDWFIFSGKITAGLMINLVNKLKA